MVRAPCCDKIGLKKGPWTREEDQRLTSYIQQNGHSNWRALPKLSGLLRCGKSCRLRWTNYLNPDIKRGNFSKEEEETIIQLHESIGNRWSAMAAKLPGRTDNEIKNVWHTHIKKKLKDSRSTQDTKGPKNIKAEPQAEKPDSSTSTKEIESLGYVSISPRSSTSELSSVIGKQELLISSMLTHSSSSELSSVTTDPDVIQQEVLISSTVPLSEFGESLCLTDIPDDQDMKVWFEIDEEGFKCLKGDDDMSFWYNLFLTAEELPEL